MRAAREVSVTVVDGSVTVVEEVVVLGQSGGPSDGGAPLLLLAALAGLVLLLGGVGTALYAHLNRPPPLVDMRRIDY